MTSSRQHDPADPSRGPLGRTTTVVYWFLVVDALVVLACLPTVVVMPFLLADASNIPLFALALLPVGPAVAAAVRAWRTFDLDRDLRPARHFLRAYRLNFGDAVRVWTPALLVLTVLAINLANSGALGLGPFWTAVTALLALGVLVLAAHALVIAANFRFRWRDLLRLGLWYLVTGWRGTLATISVVVLVVGIVVFVSEWVLLLLASVLTYLLHTGDRHMLVDVHRRFVGGGPAAA